MPESDILEKYNLQASSIGDRRTRSSFVSARYTRDDVLSTANHIASPIDGFVQQLQVLNYLHFERLLILNSFCIIKTRVL